MTDSRPSLPDELDAALVALWEGRTDALDSLLAREDGEGPGVGEMLPGAVRGGAGSPGRLPKIAGYEVIRELGRGGMGLVLEARQQHPDRLVALKLVRGVRAGDEKYQRLFDREIRTLARLRHPGIAALYGAGQTDDGAAYFAMELVEGQTLREVMDERGAAKTPAERDERIAWMLAVCRAIGYAHQRGVIHRDLKLANVVLTDPGFGLAPTGSSAGSAGTLPQVKVLDFGLARIVDDEAGRHTLTEDTDKLRGTLPYMSPEQTGEGDADVDVRSDVYALGVMLYELLLGRHPIDLKSKSLPQAIRAIAEDAPVRPGSIDPALRGDLETIVLKALEKEPDRRYAGVAMLAEDLERFRGDQPILARRPSPAYVLSKFVRRNRAVVSIMLVALFAGALLLGQTWAARSAEARQRVAAQRMSEFLEEMLSLADPEISPDDLTVRQMLERASERVGREFTDQPLVEAGLRKVIGTAYLTLARYDEAEEHLSRSISLYQSAGIPNQANALEAAAKLAHVKLERAKFDEAEGQLNDLLRRARISLGTLHETTLSIENLLATLYEDTGRFTDALPIRERLVAARAQLHGRDHVHALNAVNNLAFVQRELGKFDIAEKLWRDAIPRMESAAGRNNPVVVTMKDNLGLLLQRVGRADEAEEFLREAMASSTRVLGEAHPKTVSVLNNLALVLEDQGKKDEARAAFERVIALQTQSLGGKHPDTITAKNNLAFLDLNGGAPDKAEAVFREVVALRTEVLGPRHFDTISAQNNLTVALIMQNRSDEALAVITDAIDMARESLPPDHWAIGSFMAKRARCLADTGQFEEARETLETAIPLLEESFGPNHSRTKLARELLVNVERKLEAATD